MKNDSLLSLQIYKSDRFVITGNIGFRIVITDLHEDKSYEIQHGHLVKFRNHWYVIANDSKELFVIATISNRTGSTLDKTKEKVA